MLAKAIDDLCYQLGYLLDPDFLIINSDHDMAPITEGEMRTAQGFTQEYLDQMKQRSDGTFIIPSYHTKDGTGAVVTAAHGKTAMVWSNDKTTTGKISKLDDIYPQFRKILDRKT